MNINRLPIGTVCAPLQVAGILVCCALASAENRSIDGTGNNLFHPEWGAAGIQLLRFSEAAYADGESLPSGQDRPNPRAISHDCIVQDKSVPSANNLSNMVWLWGQFMDHDLSLSPDASGELMTIPLPQGDPWFDPFNTGTQSMSMIRSVYDPSTGVGSPREQVNDLTAWIDASMVYGSDPVRQVALRALDGTGKLRVSLSRFLPYNHAGLPMGNPFGIPNSEIYLAGDVRANENLQLLAMHTLWMREHNLICNELAAHNPNLKDVQYYERARKIVGAKIAAITYYEFLPTLLGEGVIPPYTGYDFNVNPGIATEFSSAAFRVGHTMLTHFFPRLNVNNEIIIHGNIHLKDAFFQPNRLPTEGGIEPLLQGAAALTMQTIDARIIGDVRNFLFGAPGSGGLDLATLNIQRAREHGLCDYNCVREAYQLPPRKSFAEISSDPNVQAALEGIYGDVSKVDLWVGGLAEDHVPGGNMGETFTTIIADQFVRLRDGDRFYFENDPEFTPEEIDELKETRLADVIRRNSLSINVQDDVFLAPGWAQPLLTDLNLDMNVDVLDLLEVLEGWGTVTPEFDNVAADVNGDAIVDIFDLLAVLAEWT